jgi:hypothetical protein
MQKLQHHPLISHGWQKVVNMSIERAGGQYCLEPVNNGQYWSIENSLIKIVFNWSFEC